MKGLTQQYFWHTHKKAQVLRNKLNIQIRKNKEQSNWMEVCDIVQEREIQTTPRKRNAKQQNDCLRRPYKQLLREEKLKAKEKRKDIPICMQGSKEQQGEIRKPSSVDQCKVIEENNRMGKARDLFKKNQRYQGNIS